LEGDIARVIKELSYGVQAWFIDLDEVRKDAMIDISFNLGATKLRKFVLALDAMERADYKTASEEFLDSDWSRTVKGRSVELAAMIETGEYVRIGIENMAYFQT
jgi:GH24 family phage-related lysozyme (muramidase)